MRALTYVELDIPYCSVIYGVPPCQASLTNSPPTGTIKCFNSLATCQDRENFSDLDAPGMSPDSRVQTTLRFAVDTDYLPFEIDCLPFIKEPGDIEITPAILSLGVDLGQRATVKVTMRDARHSDTGTGGDKYLSERTYIPFDQGTFFGKFRARHPFLQGRALRIVNGELGQTLEEMETRHFIVESIDGPNLQGEFSIIAKDVIKLADGDRAQAPLLSPGSLNAPITDVALSLTLSPSGVGADYPTSGYVAIGGKEIVSFTRVIDVLTITRAQYNTVAQAHEAEDRVQLCLEYLGDDVADIIFDLLVTYSGISSSYIQLPTWLDETSNFLGVVYSALIAEPTSVSDMLAELIEQAGLVLWWDDVNQLIQLQVMRGIVTDVDRYTPENMLEGTLKPTDQPATRISRVEVYFGKINPLLKQDETSNYRSTLSEIDTEAEDDYGTPAIKKVFSRWIPALGGALAQRLAEVLFSRYRDPPRRFEFAVMRGGTVPILGGGYRIESWFLQDETGAEIDAPIQITRIDPKADMVKVEAEEMLFDAAAVDLANRQLIIDSNINNINLRTSHDTLYPDPISGDVVTCTINAGVIVGSATTTMRAFDVGSWPAGVLITLIIHGRIEGAGGAGGYGGGASGGYGPIAGANGGIALYTRFAIDVTYGATAEVWGGAGGGGGGAAFPPAPGGGGGGGGGQLPGAGGAGETNPGAPGTTTAGGVAGGGGNGGQAGGAGGNPGFAGDSGGGGANGGLAGAAIDGVSFLTITGTADVQGSQVN